MGKGGGERKKKEKTRGETFEITDLIRVYSCKR